MGAAFSQKADGKDERTYMEYWDKYADHFVEQKL